MGRFIAIEELGNLSALEIEKGNFQKLNYVVNFESYFEKQICDLRSFIPWVEFEESLMFSSLVMREDTCSCFYVNKPCVNAKMGSFQQGESYIDLKASLFQQE